MDFKLNLLFKKRCKLLFFKMGSNKKNIFCLNLKNFILILITLYIFSILEKLFNIEIKNCFSINFNYLIIPL